MVRLAEGKLSGTAQATVRLGDAEDPGLRTASLDVELCHHVLWALPDPALWGRAISDERYLVVAQT